LGEHIVTVAIHPARPAAQFVMAKVIGEEDYPAQVTSIAFKSPPGGRLKSEPIREEVLGCAKATSISDCCDQQMDANARTVIVRTRTSYQERFVRGGT
jgi:hypothetical protein